MRLAHILAALLLCPIAALADTIADRVVFPADGETVQDKFDAGTLGGPFSVCVPILSPEADAALPMLWQAPRPMTVTALTCLVHTTGGSLGYQWERTRSGVSATLTAAAIACDDSKTSTAPDQNASLIAGDELGIILGPSVDAESLTICFEGQ